MVTVLLTSHDTSLVTRLTGYYYYKNKTHTAALGFGLTFFPSSSSPPLLL
jgi:hypothetical protein